MKNKRKIVMLSLLLSLVLSIFSPLMVSAEQTYTISGTWQLNSDLTLPTELIHEEVYYTTSFDSTTYKYFGASDTSVYYQYLRSDGVTATTPVYQEHPQISPQGWEDTKYSLLNFGTKAQMVSSAFYSFITQNGKSVTVGAGTPYDDLSKDPSFDSSSYPEDLSNPAPSLIQLAESSAGEVFLYFYQPYGSPGDIKSINMSPKSYEETSDFNVYSLTFISNSGCINKYKINNFTVSNLPVRYYNVAAAYRPNDNFIGPLPDGATVAYIGYEVGKCFCAYNVGTDVFYEAVDVDVVDIDIISSGIVRYSEGYLLKQEYCDSHFVAFKINNYDVTQIFDATITYTICDYSYSVGPGLDGTPSYLNSETITTDIYDWEKGSNSGGGIFGYKYEWDRIQTTTEFNKMLEEYTNEKIVFDSEGLGASEYVFNFLETDYSVTTGGTGTSSFFSKRITDIGILRLHFATETDTYNLGVVSDLVVENPDPEFNVGVDDNIDSTIEDWKDAFSEFTEEILAILAIFIIIVLILSLFPYLKPVFETVGTGVKEIGSLAWAAVTLPFTLLGELFSGKRGRK